MAAIGGEDPRVRARDVDREFTMGLLRDASVDGQLTTPEFEERLVAAQQARTMGELATLTSDLQNAAAGSRLAPVAHSPAYALEVSAPPMPQPVPSQSYRVLRLVLILITVAILLSIVLGALGWMVGGSAVEVPPPDAPPPLPGN